MKIDPKLLFDIYNGKVKVHVYNRPWLVMNVRIHVDKILRAVNRISVEKGRSVDEAHYDLLENVLELCDELEVSLEEAIDDVLQVNGNVSQHQSDVDTGKKRAHVANREGSSHRVPDVPKVRKQTKSSEDFCKGRLQSLANESSTYIARRLGGKEETLEKVYLLLHGEVGKVCSVVACVDADYCKISKDETSWLRDEMAKGIAGVMIVHARLASLTKTDLRRHSDTYVRLQKQNRSPSPDPYDDLTGDDPRIDDPRIR